jgi:hypothetical protein
MPCFAYPPSLTLWQRGCFRDSFKLAEFVMRSTNGGLTRKDLSVIAKDHIHN